MEYSFFGGKTGAQGDSSSDIQVVIVDSLETGGFNFILNNEPIFVKCSDELVKENSQVYVYKHQADGTVEWLYIGRFSVIKETKVIENEDNNTKIIRVFYKDGLYDDLTDVKWIDKIVSNERESTIYYSNGDTDVFRINSIASIAIQKEKIPGGEYSGDQKLHIQYTNTDTATIEEPLNIIVDTAVDPQTYDLLVWYSDPQRREGGKLFRGKEGWQKIGNVRNNCSLTCLVYFNTINFETIDAAIDWLKDEDNYKLDIDIGKVKQGNVVMCLVNNVQHYFGYGILADGNGWYYVGCLNNPVTKVALNKDAAIAEIEQQPIGSIIFY